MNRIQVGLLLLAVLVLVSPGLSSGAPVRPLTGVVFSISSAVPPPGTAYFWIGSYLGYFAEEGIRFKVQTAMGGTQVTQGMLARRIQLAGANQDSVLAEATTGARLPIKFVMNTLHTTIYQFAVKPDSKIARIEDLRGKTVGVNSFGSGSHAYARAVLQKAGINPDTEVRFLAVQQDAIAAEALNRGDVDALALWDLTYATMQKVLGRELRFLDQPGFLKDIRVGVMITTSEDFLRTRRDLVVGYGRAVAKSMLFMAVNPEAAVRIHWKIFPESKPTGVSEREALLDNLAQLEARIPKFLKAGYTQPLWGYFDLRGAQAYIDFYGYKGVDASLFYDPSLLKEINAFDDNAIIKQARQFKH